MSPLLNLNNWITNSQIISVLLHLEDQTVTITSCGATNWACDFCCLSSALVSQIEQALLVILSFICNTINGGSPAYFILFGLQTFILLQEINPWAGNYEWVSVHSSPVTQPRCYEQLPCLQLNWDTMNGNTHTSPTTWLRHYEHWPMPHLHLGWDTINDNTHTPL
jgi:hypothetical protein